MDEFVSAIKEVSVLSLKNDEAILKVVQTLVDEVILLRRRVNQLEENYNHLMESK